MSNRFECVTQFDKYVGVWNRAHRFGTRDYRNVGDEDVGGNYFCEDGGSNIRRTGHVLSVSINDGFDFDIVIPSDHGRRFFQRSLNQTPISRVREIRLPRIKHDAPHIRMMGS